MNRLLLPTEKRNLRSLFKGKCFANGLDVIYMRKYGEVVPISNDPRYASFVTTLFTQRNLSEACPNSVGLWAFASVGMHTDEVNSANRISAILPVKGSGVLHCMESHSGREVIKEYKFEFGRLLIFDEHKPHSFISQSRYCLALIASIKNADYSSGQ